MQKQRLMQYKRYHYFLATQKNKRRNKNYKVKHNTDAQYGWYRYTSYFALTIYTNNGELEKYNIKFLIKIF